MNKKAGKKKRKIARTVAKAAERMRLQLLMNRLQISLKGVEEAIHAIQEVLDRKLTHTVL